MDIVPAAAWSLETWRALTPMRLPVDQVWIHHGATGDGTLATLRAYDRYHVRTLRWAGLGYSYAITGDGTVYEGRGRHVGAHTGGRNSVALGVCLVGDWSRLDPPDAAVESLARLVTHLHTTGALARPVITGGHRQAPSASTACPGAGGMRAIEVARRRLAAPKPAPPQPPEEDIVATLDDLRTVVREENRLVRERANEAVRLAQAACEGTVAAHRAALGLDPDPASDRIWSARIRTGRANMVDAVDALRRSAS